MGGKNSGPRPTKATPEKQAEWRQGKVVQLLAHPRLETVPPPDLPLANAGMLKYRELAEMLLKAGQLTVITKGQAEIAALAWGQIMKFNERGEDISASLFQRYQSGLAAIQLLDVDRSAPGATEQPKNKFRYSGFSSRLR